MAKRGKRKAGGAGGGGKTGSRIVFDVAARKNFITGFRSRKDARRKVATLELAETARWDKIKAKAEQRAEIKENYKSFQRHVTRAEAWKEGDEHGSSDEEETVTKQTKKGRKKKRDASPEPEPDDDDDAKVAVDTVAFGQEEDDDLFGGCEVTTTIGVPIAAQAGSSLWGGPSETAEEKATGAQKTDAEWWKRGANIRKEEEKRKKKLNSKLARDKQMAMKKKKKPKKGKGSKGKKK